MKDFRTLKVWHKAHELVLDVYRATSDFPKAEVYGLTGQIRRSCASIPANIAEGCGRTGDAELARFLQIAMASACETEYHLLLARDLGYLAVPDYERLVAKVTEVKRMLTSFMQTLREDKGSALDAIPDQPHAATTER
ncbi:MAG: four helix bundle protein [Anaerolineales bacterium]